jgi:hypothetical protein
MSRPSQVYWRGMAPPGANAALLTWIVGAEAVVLGADVREELELPPHALSIPTAATTISPALIGFEAAAPPPPPRASC